MNSLLFIICCCLATESCLTLRPNRLYIDHQDPLSMEFSRQESWSGLRCPPPGNLPRPEIEPASLISPALAGRFFPTSATREGRPASHSKTNQFITSTTNLLFLCKGRFLTYIKNREMYNAYHHQLSQVSALANLVLPMCSPTFFKPLTILKQQAYIF